MVKAVESRHGKVDVLVNNVGWTYDRLFMEKTREEWDKEVQLNLWGMINCTRAVLDGMIEKKLGAIVSMGSDAGRMESSAKRCTARARPASSRSARASPARWGATGSGSTWSAPG